MHACCRLTMAEAPADCSSDDEGWEELCGLKPYTSLAEASESEACDIVRTDDARLAANAGKRVCESAANLRSPLVIVDGQEEVAEEFSRLLDAAKSADGCFSVPSRADVTDRPDLVRKLVSALYGPETVASAGVDDDVDVGAAQSSSSVAHTAAKWYDDHFARVRLNEYARGGRWDWHQDQVVLTLSGGSESESDAGANAALNECTGVTADKHASRRTLGRRTHKTALLYLTTCARGGETEFVLPCDAASGVEMRLPGIQRRPLKLGQRDYDQLTVQPRVGRVVCFEHTVRHRALPVIDSKRVAQVKLSDPTREPGETATPLYSF